MGVERARKERGEKERCRPSAWQGQGVWRGGGGSAGRIKERRSEGRNERSDDDEKAKDGNTGTQAHTEHCSLAASPHPIWPRTGLIRTALARLGYFWPSASMQITFFFLQGPRVWRAQVRDNKWLSRRKEAPSSFLAASKRFPASLAWPTFSRLFQKSTHRLSFEGVILGCGLFHSTDY